MQMVVHCVSVLNQSQRAIEESKTTGLILFCSKVRKVMLSEGASSHNLLVSEILFLIQKLKEIESSVRVP